MSSFLLPSPPHSSLPPSLVSPPHTVSNADSSVSLPSSVSAAEGGVLSTAENLAATTVTASLTQPLVADKLMWSPSTMPTTPKIKSEPQTPLLTAQLSTPTGECGMISLCGGDSQSVLSFKVYCNTYLWAYIL